MRRLIVNADDLGLTGGVNRAILHAHSDGIVTSATLMANGGALSEAVDQLRAPQYRNLSIGCHLVLVDGRPLSTPASLPSLVEGEEFRQSVAKLGIAARRGKVSASEIKREAIAQFQALRDLGLKLSHFDAHKHSHMFPEILEPALEAAVECGIRAVRNPFESPNPIPISALAQNPKLWKRLLQVAILRGMRSQWSLLVERSGFATPDGSLGVVVTGDLNESLLRAILEQMPEGTWELVCHPGYDDAALGQVRTRLRASRAEELSLLTSPDTKRLIERLGIELISYSDL